MILHLPLLRFSRAHASLAGAALSLALPALGLAAEPPARTARFTIGTDILVAAPVRAGANLDEPTPTHSGFWPSRNQWIANPGYEPVQYRHTAFATGGSATTFEDTAGTVRLFRTHLAGFWRGAEARIYRRATTGDISLLRTATIADYTLGADEKSSTLTFTESGPAVAAGDYVILSAVFTEVPATRQKSETNFTLERTSFAGRDAKVKVPSVTLAYDPAHNCPEGGATSLRVTLASGPALGASRWFYGLRDGRPDWAQLPGKDVTMRTELWLRQEGIANGRVTLVAGDVSKTFSVTSEWRKYSFDFPGATPAKLGRVGLHADGPGTFWVDNWVLYDTRTPLNAPGSFLVEALRAYRPGYLRVWEGLNQGATGGQSLDNWLAPLFQRRTHFDRNKGHDPARTTSLPESLALCAETGANPWLIISPVYDEREHTALIEYLAGPAESPYGKLRAAHGRTAPWTEAFEHIAIEIGNESWARIFMPLAFAGRPDFYAAWANFTFANLRASPHFAAGKFHLVANGSAGNPGDWNSKVASRIPRATALDLAAYTGGGFDTEDLSGAAADGDANLRMRLNYDLLVNRARVTDFLKIARRAKLTPFVYEFGPGFDLPEPGKGFNETDERLGKSLAGAVSTLANFLHNEAEGFGPQCFFMFRPGTRWASHSFAPEFRPQAPFLALQMRNTLATGPRLSVRTDDVPRLDLPAYTTVKKAQANTGAGGKARTLGPISGAATVECAAYRDGARFSTILLSRELRDTVSVTLEFPVDLAPSAELHLLTGPSAGASDFLGREVIRRTDPVTAASRTVTVTLPPHSIAILVTTAR